MPKSELARVEVKTSKSGKVYAAMHYYDAFGADRGFGVWVQKANYKNGCTVTKWFCVQVDMTIEAAIALLHKRAK